MKKRILFLLLIIFGPARLTFAQDTDTLQFNIPLIRLQMQGDSLLKGSTDSIRINSNKKFAFLADSIISNPISWKLSFYQSPSLSVVNSPDGKFRVYNWMLPAYDGNSFHYYGYIQTWDPKKKTVKLYHLQQLEQSNNQDAEFLKLDTSSWYGCVYYKIVHKKYKKKDYYLMLGWAPHTALTTRKIIEPISIYPNKITIGGPVLKGGGKAKQRMIFEYNSRASMSLRYNEDLEQVVFDHLSPSDPRPEAIGMYNLYGPDLSYDAFRFEKGSWYFLKNIEVGNDSKNAGKTPELKKLRVTKRDRKGQ